jgi:hypothetical protein
VLAAPAEAAVLRQLDFHHRRRIGEHAAGIGADGLFDALRQLLQALTQQLVVVASERVA